MDDDVLLEYTVDRADSRELTLSYSVRNGSTEPIFLLTPLVEIGTERTSPAPQKVYTFIDEDGILHVTKRLWYVPDDIDVYAPEVPYVTRLDPGARFVEKLACSVPVRIHYPYRFNETDEPSELLTITSSGIAFSLGYLRSREGQLRVEPASDIGGACFKVTYGSAAEHQLLLEGEPFDIQVPVQDIG